MPGRRGPQAARHGLPPPETLSNSRTALLAAAWWLRAANEVGGAPSKTLGVKPAAKPNG